MAKKVVSIELDKRLLPVLDETLADFDNLEIVNGDVMELDLKKLIKEKFEGCDNIKVCANLPYYITSPIIMMLLENELPGPISSTPVLLSAFNDCAILGQTFGSIKKF